VNTYAYPCHPSELFIINLQSFGPLITEKCILWCDAGAKGLTAVYHCDHGATWATSFLSLAVTLMFQKIYGCVSVECVCVCVLGGWGSSLMK